MPRENGPGDAQLVLGVLDPRYAIGLLQMLLRFPTVNPPGRELALARFLAEEMERLGLEARLYPLDQERGSVVAWLPTAGAPPGPGPAGGQTGGGSARWRRALVFSGHLDVVPPGDEAWDFDPFDGVFQPGRVGGRGASDMKGAVAAMVAAAGALARARLRRDYDLVWAFTAGEEVDSAGAQDLVRRGALDGAAALVVGEPTDLEIAVAEKGALWLELTVHGRAAHGSMPEQGDNAILRMARALEAIDRLELDADPHPLLGRPTVSVGTVSGGTKTNVVASRCMVTLDVRTVPGQDHQAVAAAVAEAASRAAGGEARLELRIVNDRPPVETNPSHPLVGLVTDVSAAVARRPGPPRGVPYYTDAAVLAPALGVPTVILGPGDPAQAHRTSEWVSVDNVIHATRIYAVLAARFGEYLAAGGP